MIFWPRLGDVAFFRLPQEDDAVERMRLAKMLRLPGEEGVGLPGDGVDCHQIAIMFYQFASLGDLHGYPNLVKHPPYDWSVRTHTNWNQNSAFRSNINEAINLQKGWTMHAEEPGIVNTNHESMPGFTPWFGVFRGQVDKSMMKPLVVGQEFLHPVSRRAVLARWKC